MKGFMDGYKTYDTSEGYGNRSEWKDSFHKTMGREEAETILKKQDNSPWGILGVSKNATKAQIKKAFRELIMKWHPDKNPHNIAEAEEMSKKIIAAYTILT